MDILKADNLVKVYPNGVKALDGVSLIVGRGIYSIMGPNGSGKSTALSICSGSLRPTEGEVYVLGFDLWGGQWLEARRYIGYAPQDMPFNPKLSALDNLIWYGLIKNMSIGDAKASAKRMLDKVGLYEYRNVLVSRYSGGMKRRLTIIASILHNPDIVILDEPGSGLDPKAREDIWMYIQDVMEDRTLIFSSHDAKEVERFSSETYIFHKGRLIAYGEPKRLIDGYVKYPYVSVWFKGDIEPPEIDGVKPIIFGSIGWYSMGEIDLPDVINYLRRNNIMFNRVEVLEPNLDIAFILMTGERLVIQ